MENKKIKNYTYQDFNLNEMIRLKEKRGLTISVVIPTLNEEKNVGKILDVVKNQLIYKNHFVDELVVLDSGSTDNTKKEVEKKGVEFHYSKDILKQYGHKKGKGENLWKSLYITQGDIIVWIDADSINPDAAYIYGLVGPILTEKNIKFSKAFFTRFTHHNGNNIPPKPNGGRVTEILGRPIINLLFPEISGIYQPFNGNVAGMREVFESISIPSGYGIETSMLIDVALNFGIKSIAQVFCKSFEQDGQDLTSLGRMGFQALRMSLYKAQEYGRITLNNDLPYELHQLDSDSKGNFSWVKSDLFETIRPPIKNIVSK